MRIQTPDFDANKCHCVDTWEVKVKDWTIGEVARLECKEYHFDTWSIQVQMGGVKLLTLMRSSVIELMLGRLKSRNEDSKSWLWCKQECWYLGSWSWGMKIQSPDFDANKSHWVEPWEVEVKDRGFKVQTLMWASIETWELGDSSAWTWVQRVSFWYLEHSSPDGRIQTPDFDANMQRCQCPKLWNQNHGIG